MKPCRRCGGEKGPGMRRHYCDVCQPIIREARLHRTERKPCRRCDGPKEAGRRSWYCAACSVIVAEENARAVREPWVPVSVPNDVLREAFLRSGMTKAEAAHALGWYGGRHPTGTPKVDTTRFSRTVGMGGHAYRSVHRPTAVSVAKALGLDPVDLDV